MEESKLEQQRQILRTLHRRELQARAKALGVRANGKTVEIIEAMARVLSGLASPSKPNDVQQATDDTATSDVERIASGGSGASEGGEGVAVKGDGLRTESADCGSREESSPVHNPSEATHPPHHSSPPARSSSPAAGYRDTPPMALDAGNQQESPVGTVPASFQSTPSTRLSPACRHAVAAATPSIEELAARATAAALAARMHNMRIDSHLKTKAMAIKGAQQPAPAEEASSDAGSPSRALELGPLPALAVQPCDPDEVAADLAACSRLSPVQVQVCAGYNAVRQLAFDPGASPAAGIVAGSREPAAAAAAADRCAAGAATSHNSSTAGAEGPADMSHGVAGEGASTQPPTLRPAAADGSGKGHDSTMSGADEQDVTLAPGAVVSQLAIPSVVVGITAPTLAAPTAGVGTGKATAVHVTARTPLRQQRVQGLGVGPPPAGATTPFGRPAGVLGGCGASAAPRTPGMGLRTPARRVPVCIDEAQARAMDEWVRQHLFFPAGQLQHHKVVAWRDLLGLQAAKERLEAVCFQNPASDAHNAAVLMYGPPGVGKAHLARALATELGAAYLHVPPDLSTRAAPSGGGADAVLRAVFRVAAQAPSPVVVHVEDVELLAGVEAGRHSEGCRRARTELLVGVDELLLQSAATGSTSQNSPAAGGVIPDSCTGAGGASSSSGNVNSGAPRLKVLVLSTSSRPMDMDTTLAASLGRTERLMVVLPDAEARETYLVGRLASDGAALGVAQVERLVRQTEGCSCGELAALCDAAVAAAAARKGTMQQEGAAVVCEHDMDVALTRVLRNIPSQGVAVAELEQWHMRTSTAQPRLGQRQLLAP